MAKYQAKESFAFQGRNGPRTIVKGTVVDGRDPDLKGRERFFELAGDRPGRRGSAVEDASAEPNGRRALGRPRGGRR